MESEEKYNIKLNFYGDQAEVVINSDFNSFIKNICNVLKIPQERAKSIILSYNDEDGDNILLSNEEDYSIFIEQVKQEVVQELIIEIKDNIEDNVLNNQKGMEQSKIKNSCSSINISNSNMNSIHNFDNQDIFDEEDKKLIEEFKDKKFPIENFVYYYKCTSCSTYPIILIMYYCDKCNKYLCENCYKKDKNHCHIMEKIINKFQLDEIKRMENETIEKINEIKNEKECNCGRCKNHKNNNNYNNSNNGYNNGYNNNCYHNNYNCGNNNGYNNNCYHNDYNYGHNNGYYNNSYHNNYNQNRNHHYNNYNQNDNYYNNSINNYNYPNENRYGNNNLNTNSYYENQHQRISRMLGFLKRRFNFGGIDDQQLMEMLLRVGGDFNQAIAALSPHTLNNRI